jgi:hypothetical protein
MKILKIPSFVIFILIAGLHVLLPQVIIGAEREPTLFITAGGGLTTHKSEFVSSNDTSYSYDYSFGVHAASDDQLTMSINTSADKTKFELNSSSVENEFQDSILQYAFGPVFFGAIVSQTKMVVSRATDVPVEIDAIGTGFGGLLGAKFPVGREGSVFFDVKSVTTSNVKEIHDEEFTIGSRLDISIGATYAITRSLLDGMFGLRQRSYEVGLDGSASAETVTTTWFGLGVNLSL